MDITDRQRVLGAVAENKPEVIIHAAAVAHGDASENQALLDKVNVQGTQNIVDAAKIYGSKIIFISSVGALQNSPYGKSKLAGEQMVKAGGLGYLILRPSVMFGLSPNREVDITFNKILKAVIQKACVIEDRAWKFQPTWLLHVCEIINLWLAGKFNDTEPIYPVIQQIKSRYDISNDILAHFNLQAKAIDQPRYAEDKMVTEESLLKNHLPIYDYNRMMAGIWEELESIQR